MRVMHVSLGLPPLRTGGLTRYCSEVMEAQVVAGNEVSLVYPGRYARGGTRMRRGSWRGIATYEVVNPLPVALTYGVAEPAAFCAPCGDAGAYRRLLDEVRPDVVHVHSFQGVHRELFEAAREMGVAMVFTTHDYYPMCPRCTLITSWGESCQTGPSPEACAACNRGAGMTARRSRVMQSGLYARMKGSVLVRAVGARAKRGMSSEATPDRGVRPEAVLAESEAFGRLLGYNRSIFGLFNLVLANSLMTMEEYQRRFLDARYELLPITHAGLERDETPLPEQPEGAPLRIGYYGGKKAYKGYGTLVEACRILDERDIPFELHLYGDDYGDVPACAHAIDHGRVAPQAIRGTWRTNDVVVVPSKCRETFGFVALEALCSGVPVICSDVVGARDLVDEERVFRAGDAEDLARVVEGFARSGDRSAGVLGDYPLSMDEQLGRLTSAYCKAAAYTNHVGVDGGASLRLELRFSK